MTLSVWLASTSCWKKYSSCWSLEMPWCLCDASTVKIILEWRGQNYMAWGRYCQHRLDCDLVLAIYDMFALKQSPVLIIISQNTTYNQIVRHIIYITNCLLSPAVTEGLWNNLYPPVLQSIILSVQCYRVMITVIPQLLDRSPSQIMWIRLGP